MDIVYTQEIANPLDDDTPLIYYATIPIQRRAVKHVLPFYSLDGCETHVAMAGMDGEVRIEATNAITGASYGSYVTASGKKHTAFQLSRAIPRIQEEGIGGAHIYGKVALMGLDFCDGQLIQFRLPHAGPEHR